MERAEATRQLQGRATHYNDQLIDLGDDSGDGSISSNESSLHYLDGQTDVRTTARRFFAADVGSSSGEDGEGDDDGEARALNTGNRSQLLRCGGDRHCLDSFQDSAILR